MNTEERHLTAEEEEVLRQEQAVAAEETKVSEEERELASKFALLEGRKEFDTADRNVSIPSHQTN